MKSPAVASGVTQCYLTVKNLTKLNPKKNHPKQSKKILTPASEKQIHWAGK